MRVTGRGVAAAVVAVAVALPVSAVSASAGPMSDDRLVPGAGPGRVAATRADRSTKDVVRKIGIIDGDTFTGVLPGSKRRVIVRNAGIQSMEDRECGAKDAKALLARTLGKKRVVIVSKHNSARTNKKGIYRLQRNAFTSSGRDVQLAMINSGLVLPYGIGRETLRQEMYAKRAQEVAAARKGLFSGSYCRPGPVQEAQLELQVNYDASGRDWDNLSGKFVRVRNLSPVDVPIGRWRLRGGAHDSFYFPQGTILPASGEVIVRLGSGAQTATTFFWQGHRMRFFVPGQSRYQGGGAYLFDTDGDIRAWSMYPCRVYCTHPAQGALTGTVAARDRDATPSASPTASPTTSPTPSVSGSPSPSGTSSPIVSPSPTASGSVGASPTEDGSPSPSPTMSTAAPSATEQPERLGERIAFTNVSDRVVDLSYTVALVRDQVHELPPGTVLAPGERLLIFTGEGEDTRLRQYLGVGEPFLFFKGSTGGSAKLRTHTGIRIACVAWGDRSCES